MAAAARRVEGWPGTVGRLGLYCGVVHVEERPVKPRYLGFRASGATFLAPGRLQDTRTRLPDTTRRPETEHGGDTATDKAGFHQEYSR